MNYQLDSQQLRRRLSRSHHTYEKHAVLQQELARRVVERLCYIKHQPQSILDLSVHRKDAEALLKRQYPKASYVSASIYQAPVKRQWFKKPKYMSIDFHSLPLQDASIDFIFMNMTMLWCQQWPTLLQECRRVLRPGGMLFFTTLGPDSLKELRQAFCDIDDNPHLHDFVDMHDIGDALVKAGFENPVMDQEHLVYQYSSLTQLFDDLKLSGTSNLRNDRAKGLMTPRQLKRLQVLCGTDIKATFECVYGHAWAGKHRPQRQGANGEVAVSISNLLSK